MAMGVGSGGQGGRGPLWIFKHCTNIVDRGLKVLFSAFFPLPPPLKEAKEAVFRYFLLIFGIFC